MANTFIKSTTKFKPFSYQEMLAPVLAYKEAYDKADDELTLLYEDAAAKAFNFATQDIKEKAIYNNMMKDLQAASDALHSGDKTAFKSIRDINKEYRQTMIPIQMKLAKRAELVKEQQLLQRTNPYIRFDKDYSKESLDNITSSSTYNTYDLNTIYTNVAKKTASLISSMYRDQVGTPTNIKGTNYYSIVSGYGYTANEYAEQMKDKESPLYKYVQKAKEEATIGINDPTLKTEIEVGVEKTIQSNIGKFESYRVQGIDRVQARKLEQEKLLFDYMYDLDDNGNLVMSKQYQEDKLRLQGYTWNEETESWEKPGTPKDNTSDKKTTTGFIPKGDASITLNKWAGKNGLNITALIDDKHEIDIDDGKYTGYPVTLEEISLRLGKDSDVYKAALQLLEGKPEYAQYYNLVWVDTTGRGGKLVRTPKQKQTILNSLENEVIDPDQN